MKAKHTITSEPKINLLSYTCRLTMQAKFGNNALLKHVGLYHSIRVSINGLYHKDAQTDR